MSIVALKRKTYAQYNNMSVGSPHGFSLNGTHRNQGYVGQTSLSRFLSRTTMKGNTPKGHGGCCGQYHQARIVQSAVTSLEDSTVVKKSVLGTKGMLDTKNRWIRRPQPYMSVKPDVNNHMNTQHQYVDHLKKKTINESCSVVSNEKKQEPVGCDIIDSAQRPRLSSITRTCNFTTKPEKSVNKDTGLPYSINAYDGKTYIDELRKKCEVNNDFRIVNNIRRVPMGLCSGNQ